MCFPYMFTPSKKPHDLFLHVKKEFFNEIKSGEKTEEYRICSNYWNTRFSDDKLPFTRIIIQLGYPGRSDTDLSRTLIFPFRGIEQKEILHPLFGDKSVWVHAIRLEQRRDVPALSQ